MDQVFVGILHITRFQVEKIHGLPRILPLSSPKCRNPCKANTKLFSIRAEFLMHCLWLKLTSHKKLGKSRGKARLCLAWHTEAHQQPWAFGTGSGAHFKSCHMFQDLPRSSEILQACKVIIRCSVIRLIQVDSALALLIFICHDLCCHTMYIYVYSYYLVLLL